MVKHGRKHETNSRVERIYYRELFLVCPFCPPNQGENTQRRKYSHQARLRHKKKDQQWLRRRKVIDTKTVLC